MAFPTDARNHYSAIESEINLSNYNSQIENIFGKKTKEYIHLGGTKNKTDVKIIFSDNTFENITLKNKKNIKSGSFDWVNTTSFCKEQFTKSIDIFNKYRGVDDSNNKTLLENAIQSELRTISCEKLTEMFRNEVYNKFMKNNLKILIIDQKTQTIHMVAPKIFDLINSGFVLSLDCSKGKTSSKIIVRDHKNKEVDLGLRIRVHLNNGWTKWIKGQTSVLCVKFQQDKVYKMLNYGI